MKQSNRDFLEKNRHHYTTLIKAFYMRSLDGATRSEMQRIMGEEFQPGYHTDLWCGPCISDMVKLLYQRYDRWLLDNPEPAATPPPDEKPLPSPEAITVAANFPAHKKNHKRK